MFAITTDQLDALQHDQDLCFLRHSVSILETDYREKYSVADCENFARRVMLSGRSRGYRTSSHLEGWLRLNAEFGEDFETLPWVCKILGDKVLTPQERLHVLQRRAVFEIRKPRSQPISVFAA